MICFTLHSIFFFFVSENSVYDLISAQQAKQSIEVFVKVIAVDIGVYRYQNLEITSIKSVDLIGWIIIN